LDEPAMTPLKMPKNSLYYITKTPHTRFLANGHGIRRNSHPLANYEPFWTAESQAVGGGASNTGGIFEKTFLLG
jgi:hypothetical protein